jgi:molybdate transport system substrate-binding protein
MMKRTTTSEWDNAMRKTLLAVVLASFAITPALAAEVVVFCPGAVQSVVRDLVKSYEQKSGNTVKFEFATAGAIAKRIAGGAEGDVVLATNADLAVLAKEGKVDGGTIRDLGSMGVGVAVKVGAPKPDIHDIDAFKKSMLAATSIMYANPAKGGQSGIHVAKMFAKLGIDKQIESKLQLRDRGPDGLKEVAAGSIDVGLGQISEILANKDVVLVGPLPTEIQGAVTFSASVHSASKNKQAAEGLIQELTTSAAKEQFKARGFTVS